MLQDIFIINTLWTEPETEMPIERRCRASYLVQGCKIQPSRFWTADQSFSVHPILHLSGMLQRHIIIHVNLLSSGTCLVVLLRRTEYTYSVWMIPQQRAYAHCHQWPSTGDSGTGLPSESGTKPTNTYLFDQSRAKPSSRPWWDEQSSLIDRWNRFQAWMASWRMATIGHGTNWEAISDAW